ncbi:MAG: tetratricopeptide repeat protein [Allosphingosinicella sp.]
MATASLWPKLRARGVPRAAATYLVTCWLILEVGHLLSLILDMPHVAMRFVFWLLVVGFLPAMIFASSSGMFAKVGEVDLPETEPASRAEHRLHEGDGESGHGHARGGEVDPLPFIVGGLILLALAFLGAGRYLGMKTTEEAAAHADVPAVTAPAPARPAAAVAAARNSVAVLPFANLSGDAGQDYFSDGLSEEVLDALARLRQLQVAARTSSFSFKDKSVDVATIAARFGVAYVLDGSVRRDGDMIRVSASLIDARTGFKTWSETYDRKLTDIFAVQQGIAAAVAQALQVELAGDDLPQVAQGGTANTLAYDEYLKGRQLVDRSASEAEWRQALARFDAALAADPSYASAHAARARALIALANAFLPAAQVRAAHDAALAGARRAVELAPRSADSQSTYGYALVSTRLDFAGAAAPFQRSLELGGGDADILIRYGLYACRTGKAEQGLEALHNAVALDPLNPRAHKSLALGLYAAHDYAGTVDAMRRALALSPSMTLAHWVVGDALLALGNAAGAEAEYKLEPVPWARTTGLAVAAARAGRKDQAKVLLDGLVKDFGDGNAYQQAEIRAQLGDVDGAVDSLRRARNVADIGLFYVWTDPWLDPARGDPAFKSFIARLG